MSMKEAIIQAYLSLHEPRHILDILKHPEEVSVSIEALNILENFEEVKEKMS